jgi:hypothetical protein
MNLRELARRRATRRAVLSRDLHDAYGTVNARRPAAGPKHAEADIVMIPWLLVARTTSGFPRLAMRPLSYPIPFLAGSC